MSGSSLVARTRRRPELQLVPLIDVLTMLIFFSFVTMQFKSATSLNITPPKFNAAGKNAFKGPITIGIEKDGAIALNGKIVTDDQLMELLREEADKETPVMVKVDEDSQVKKLAVVMNACTLAGLKNVQLQSR